MTAPEITTSPVADILRQALTSLRRPINRDGNGWRQGDFGRSAADCQCADGAIRAAAAGEGGLASTMANRRAAQIVFTQANDLPYYGCGSSIWTWNDADGRTFPEVESAFQRAIELAEAGAR